MEISEKDLILYMTCKRKYQIMKTDRFEEEDKKLKDYVQMALNKFYTTIQDASNKTDKMKVLQAKWDSVVINNPAFFDMFGGDNVLNGMNQLIHIYSFFKANNVKFLSLNTPYVIDIDGSGMAIKGVMNPIIDMGAAGIEILSFHYGSREPKKDDLELDVKLSLDAYVANKLFNRPIRIRVHSLRTNYDGRTDIFITKNKRDFLAFEDVIKNVQLSISNNIVFPSISLECTRCHLKYLCKSWSPASIS